MAVLTKKKKVEVPTNEVEETTAPASEETTPETAAPAETQAAEEKSVVVKESAGAVATVSDVVVPTLASLNGVMDPVEFDRMFPAIKGASGDMCSNKGHNFGKFIDMQVMSHNIRWFITPVNTSDRDQNKKNQKYCRPSYDNKNIVDRETGDEIPNEEYMESIPGVEFEKKKYHDVHGIIFNADKDSAAAEAIGMVTVGISPTMTTEFNSFVSQTKISVMRKVVSADKQNCVRLRSEGITGDFVYTIIHTEAVPKEIAEKHIQVLE